MFKKTIAVLLMLSIVLSSCGKKDKSNDFVRATPVESQESFESSESPEIRDTSETPTLIKTSTPITCDGLAPCRFIRDHWQYEMINVFDVAITPKRVFWTVTAVGSAYAVYKMPVLRWKRTLFGQRNTNGEYGSLMPQDHYDSISDWIRDLRCWSVFKHKHKRSPYAPAPAPAPVETPLTPICEDEEIWKEWFVSQPPRFVPAHLANSIFAQPDVQFNSVRAKFVARYGSTLPSSVPLSHPALIPAPAEPPPALVTSVDSTVMVRDIGVNTFESILHPLLLPSPMFGNSVDLCEYSLVVRSKSEHIETRSVRLDVQPDLIPSDGANQLKMYKNPFLTTVPYFGAHEVEYESKERIPHPVSPPLVLGDEEKLESIEHMNKRRGIASSVVNIPSEHYTPP